jgi:hypothetical protein
VQEPPFGSTQRLAVPRFGEGFAASAAEPCDGVEPTTRIAAAAIAMEAMVVRLGRVTIGSVPSKRGVRTERAPTLAEECGQGVQRSLGEADARCLGTRRRLLRLRRGPRGAERERCRPLSHER